MEESLKLCSISLTRLLSNPLERVAMCVDAMVSLLRMIAFLLVIFLSENRISTRVQFVIHTVTRKYCLLWGYFLSVG